MSMNKKNIGLSALACASVVVLTSCMQEPMVKKLQGSLLQANIKATKLFGYTPDYELVPTKSPDGNLITISAHGYGSNKKTGFNIAKYAPLSGHVLTFNLPDHDYRGNVDHQLTHGSIHEILPFLYAFKTAINAGADHINLYGFSAGGGVIVNVLAALNSTTYDLDLERIGIDKALKETMIRTVEQGMVILDVPLKSVEEIINGRGSTKELELFANKYSKNNLRPIDSLAKLDGLKLQVLVYFEKPDEILYNTDDALFIERLKQANFKGTTRVLIGTNGGHNSWHKELWSAYKEATTNL